jgi:chromosome partitioning protein
LSRAKKGTRLKTEAIEVLSDMGVPLLSQTIHDKQIVADTFGQKSFVFDMDGLPAADASKEFHTLFRELIQL